MAHGRTGPVKWGSRCGSEIRKCSKPPFSFPLERAKAVAHSPQDIKPLYDHPTLLSDRD